MVNPPIPDNEARQAIDALAGYSYQLYQTLLAWLGLAPDEFLFVEVAEDYAVATAKRLDATQVKATATNITLHTEAVIDAINAYWSTRKKNPGQRVSYHYLTTSNIGKEQGLKFPGNVPGLEYWRIAARPGSDLKPIRDALLSINLDQDLKDFVQTASDDDLRADLLAAIHWEWGAESLAGLKEAVELKTIARAQASVQAMVEDGKKLVLPLVGHLLGIAISKTAPRRLTSVELDEFIQERQTTRVPTSILAGLLGQANLLQAPGYTEAPVIIDSTQIPFPEPLLERTAPLDQFAPIASRNGILFIQGGSGKGKSTLARLLAKKLGQQWSVLDFRGSEITEANGRLAFAAARLPKGSLILDDFPVEFDANVEQLLAVVARMVRLQDGLVIVTSNSKPSTRLLSLLGGPNDSVVEAPNLTSAEVAAAVDQLGGEGKLWGPIVHAVCGGGHPQLVMARLRRLAHDKWPKSQVFGGIDPTKPAEEIEDEKASTRKRLIGELDDSTRSFVDRLSVIGMRFDRQLALAVAGIEPPIPNAGDALTMLTGPWIEKLDRSFMRLSPLLMGSAKENLLPASIKQIHAGAVIALMSHQPIDGSMIGQAFFHAWAGDVDGVLARIVMLPILVEDEKREFVAEQLSMLEVFRTDQLLRPQNLYVSIFMRLGQFKVCAVRGSSDLIEKVALRLIEEVSLLPEDQLGEGLGSFVICLVLSEQKLPKAIPGWCGFILKYLDFTSKAEGPLGEFMREREKALGTDMGADVPQFLFIFQGTRKSDLTILEEVFADLDSTTLERRAYLLSSFDTEYGDRTLFVANAWLGETEKTGFDPQDASRRFLQLAERAEQWGDIKLALECIVASAIMLDEYAKVPDQALQVLDTADAHFGGQIPLRQERAKVLHRKGDHADALKVIREIGDQIDPKNYVDRAFFYRTAGMSAGELQQWDEAIEFFGKAREAALKAVGDGGLTAMSIGLLGDLAGCAVKAGQVDKGLGFIKQAIEELERIEPPAIPILIQTRHLIGHVPAWMNERLSGSVQASPNFTLPMGKCSQQEIIPAILDRSLYPLDLLWYQLAEIELRANLDLGIRSSIKAWPDERKILSMEFMLAKEDLDRAIRLRDVDKFQSAVVSEITALDGMTPRAKELKAEPLTKLSRGAFPPLSNLDGPLAGTLIHDAVVAFALFAFLTKDEDALTRLLALKDGTVAQHPVFKATVALLGEGEKAGTSLAGYLYRMRTEKDLSPNDVFRIQCQFLQWLAQSAMTSRPLNSLLAAWVKKTWLQIIDEQRFRLRVPFSTVPLIEKALASEPSDNLSYAARVLLAADEAVGVQLSTDFHKLLRDIMSGKK